MHEMYKILEENYIKDVIEKINKTERRRHSLPDVELSELEFDTLIAIAQGRVVAEIDAAIKRIDVYQSYNSVSRRIIYKLQANNMPHALCKAIAMKLIKPSEILNVDEG